MQQPPSVVSNAAMSPAVSLKIVDAAGNLTTGTNSVSMAILNNAGPGGVLTGGTAIPAVRSEERRVGKEINLTGSGYTLQATATGLVTNASPGSSSFDVTP